MRRGLMGWDEAELPRSALSARLERLQAAMAREGFEALILYTNLVRPAAVCWLTGFTPYWIESLLLLPRDGTTLLATALSKRVSDWVRATSRIADIVNTPKPGTAIGTRLANSLASRSRGADGPVRQPLRCQAPPDPWRLLLRCARDPGRP